MTGVQTCALPISGIIAGNSPSDFVKEGDMQVILYPNPSSGEFNVDINSTVKGQLDITVFNALGQIVKSYTDSEFDGMTSKTIDLKNNGSSYYIVKVQAPGHTIYRKAISVK